MQDIYSKSVLKKFRGGKNVPEKKIGGARATLQSGVSPYTPILLEYQVLYVHF